MDPRWLLLLRAIEELMRILNRQVLTISIMVKSNERTDEILVKGISLGDKKLRVKRYINSGPDILCRY